MPRDCRDSANFFPEGPFDRRRQVFLVRFCPLRRRKQIEAQSSASGPDGQTFETSCGAAWKNQA